MKNILKNTFQYPSKQALKSSGISLFIVDNIKACPSIMFIKTKTTV